MPAPTLLTNYHKPLAIIALLWKALTMVAPVGMPESHADYAACLGFDD
jgi:hypothetical protein